MKKAILIIAILITGIEGFSQSPTTSTRKKFSTIIDVFTDINVNIPDSVDTRFFNLGANFSGLYDYRFGESDYSFAFGIGIGSHNFYNNCFVVVDTLGVSEFQRIKTLYPGTNYDKNKISYTYFDIPLEFRLRTKKEIRAALGFKFGFLIDTHSKYKGDDYLYETNDQLLVKFKDVDNIQDLRYGITARVGWKFINLTGFYSLSKVFENQKGPDMYPISVGISLMPF
ncbi:MAG: PorT family protein [Bacteroidales bacterium]|nr:PorT family protein [Bacteroidales bacterium]